MGAASAWRRAGFERVIAFDMGGTSTDVTRWDGDFEYVWEHRVGDAQLVAPALAIESVAAGGGSVCGADANGVFVGPRSACDDPGPACYGAGAGPGAHGAPPPSFRFHAFTAVLKTLRNAGLLLMSGQPGDALPGVTPEQLPNP